MLRRSRYPVHAMARRRPRFSTCRPMRNPRQAAHRGRAAGPSLSDALSPDGGCGAGDDFRRWTRLGRRPQRRRGARARLARRAAPQRVGCYCPLGRDPGRGGRGTPGRILSFDFSSIPGVDVSVGIGQVGGCVAWLRLLQSAFRYVAQKTKTVCSHTPP